MQRKSVIQPVFYLAVILLVIAVLSSIGGGWVEYQNLQGTKTFHFDVSPTAYSELVRAPGTAFDHSDDHPAYHYYRSTWPGGSFFDVQIAHWVFTLPVAIPAVLLTLGVIKSRRRFNARVARGQCVKCGYDLTATPERCPECGAFVA